MRIFKSKTEIHEYILQLKNDGKSIGFVPTMGALHEGHLTLVRTSKMNNDMTVVSIFVNPIQFNNKTDLANYPRNFEADAQMLENEGCDILFLPNEQEMYPDEVKENYNLGGLDLVMEGAFRPGHFQGVAIVVKRFFDIIPADRAYFGKKDFQQLSIIKYLVNTLNIPVTIISCETIREKDGLAKSSRNQLLEKKYRESAVIIPTLLNQVAKMRNDHSPAEICEHMVIEFKRQEDIKLEYFEIVEENTLKPAFTWEKNKSYVACIAAWAGNVRLIDNVSI